MADSKITALTALTAADPVNDMFPVVDVSDTSMAASGTTKRISANNILSSSPTASGALTVTGLVTAGSASITGAATVGTTLGVTSDLTVGTSPFALKVFPATNRVLINQAAAIQGDPLEISADSGGSAMSIFGRASDNQSTITFRANGAATQKAQIQGGDVGINFVTASTIRQVISSSTGDITVSTGNLVMGTSGKGIDFSATAGTGTSELLADYEEGTWTGTLKGSVSNPTVAVTATGKYTKVGRQVTVNISYNNVSTVGASGNVTIDGLPFTGADNFAGSSIAFDLFAISTTLASWNAGTEIEFFITGAYVKATHNPGTGRYLTTTLTYIV